MGAAMALEGRSLAIFLVSIIMMSLALAIVSLRTFVRLSIVRAFGWDDASMIAALVSSWKVPSIWDCANLYQCLFILLNCCCIIGSMNGIGHTYTDFTSVDIYKKALVVGAIYHFDLICGDVLTIDFDSGGGLVKCSTSGPLPLPRYPSPLPFFDWQLRDATG